MPSSFGDEVRYALHEITSLLTNVVERVERVETELQQQRSVTPSSSNDSTHGRTKASVHVPLVVRVNDCIFLSSAQQPSHTHTTLIPSHTSPIDAT